MSVAKFFGIRVDEFGLGYPPRAARLFNWKGTIFTLNWLPFGGFVKIFGENYEEQRSDLDTDSQGQTLIPSNSFQHKNRGIQAAVLVAGVVGNFLFAWFLFFIGFLFAVPAIQALPPEITSSGPAIWRSLVVTLEVTKETFFALIQFFGAIFVGQADFANVAGPIGLVSLVGQVGQLGFSYLLTFTALISINLSIINLLPLPALDGGRLLFVGIESITRHRIAPRIFNLINSVGFALLILLMIVVTFHDVRNIF